MRRILTLGVIILCLAKSLSGSLTFKDSSVLRDGKWVKVEIDSTGLYFIPNELLASMGFSAGSQIGVWGKGGEMFSINFSDDDGGAAYSDDLTPVPVIKTDTGLVFYGQGTSRISWDDGEKRFIKKSKNIYSDTGVYFLTDRYPSPVVAESETDDIEYSRSDFDTVRAGCDYIYHEKDLCHNVTATGQLFWGEDFQDEKGELCWDASCRLAASGTATLECQFYIEPYPKQSIPFSYGMEIEHAEPKYFEQLISPASSQYLPKTFVKMFNVGKRNEYKIHLKAGSDVSDFEILDFWILSYPKCLPCSLDDVESQEHYVVYNNDNSGSGVNLFVPRGVYAVEIAENDILSYRYGGDDGDYITLEKEKFKELVFFKEPDLLMKPLSWQMVSNSNIHSLAGMKPEFAIITTPELEKYASEIAILHKQYDDMNSVVVTTEQLYNEFSGGVPDPMAYRAFVKMIYEKVGGCLKNILLFGPSQGDFRKHRQNESDTDRHIAFQELSPTVERDAACVYDFYGFMADEIRKDALYRSEMHVGVGVLNCETEDEAERVVRKIKRYLSDDASKAWMLNETLSIGGVGDMHAHDWQAVEFGELIGRKSQGRCLNTVLSVDAYGNKEAKVKLNHELEKGILLTTYFGHGSRNMLGRDTEFYNTYDAVSSANKKLGFAFLGGCDFSLPDKRIRGIGENWVIDAENGMVGAVVSTRSSLSSQNYNLASRFISAWFDTDVDTNENTIGRIYARSKSNSDYANSLGYFLAGDPALKVPLSNSSIVVDSISEIVGGCILKLEGRILDNEFGQCLDFNGIMAVKIVKPSMKLASNDYISSTCRSLIPEERDTLWIEYKADPFILYEGIVENGKFDLEIPIKKDIEKISCSELGYYLSSYDSKNKTGASGVGLMQIKCQTDSTGNEGGVDTIPPVMEIEFEKNNLILRIEVTDDCGMVLTNDSFSVKLNGEYIEDVDVLNRHRSTIRKNHALTIDLLGYKSGIYNVSVCCRDVSGNVTCKEYGFEIEDRDRSLGFELNTLVWIEPLNYKISRGEAAEYVIQIRDTKGEELQTIRTDSLNGVLEPRDKYGCQLSPGLYRIRVMEKSDAVFPAVSQWCTVAVLE